MSKKPDTAAEMVEALNEFLLDPAPDFREMPADRVAAYLKKNRLDSAGVFKVARTAVAEARAQLELAKARERRLRIEQRPLSVKSRHQIPRQALLDKIREIAGTQAASVYARKFEDTTDEDLRSLLDDFEFLAELSREEQ